MNLNEKLLLIKNELKNETPEVDHILILKSAVIDSNSKTSNYFPLYTRFILKTLITFAFLIFIGFSIFSNYKGFPEQNPNLDSPTGENPLIPPRDSDNEKAFPIGNFSRYAFGTKTLVSLFANNSNIFSNNNVLPNNLEEKDINLLNIYMNALEMFLEEPLKTDLSSDKDDYLYLTKYTSFDLLANEHTFFVYHNDLSNNRIDCLVIYNNQEYILQGNDYTNYFSFKINYQPNSFIEVISDNGIYSYIFKIDGILQNKYRSLISIVQDESKTFKLQHIANESRIPIFTITKGLNNQVNIDYNVYASLSLGSMIPRVNGKYDYDNSELIDSGTIILTVTIDNQKNYFYEYELDQLIITKNRYN